ncbi:MAG: fibronectin type III-like domain-contianing protein [Firmicutes bacterium]|nr:fibronectin type III-like domain-contianing protein [Bacillota bacterium]
MSKKKVIKIVKLSAMGLIVGILIAANIVAASFSNIIAGWFASEITQVNVETTRLATYQSKLFSHEIQEEGSVLLKNSNFNATTPALPLTGVTNLNVFGWGATEGGFVVSGGGSGDATGVAHAYADEHVTFLEALEDAGFSYNKDLINMYEAYRSERDGIQISNAVQNRMFRLYEPGATRYTPALWSQAESFSQTALIVLSRIAGEGNDLPYRQFKHPQTGGSVSGNSGTNFVTDNTRTYLQTSVEEDWLINEVTRRFDRVVVILNTCNAMELGFLEHPGIHAALSVNATGQYGTTGIANLLRGSKKVNTYETDSDGNILFTNNKTPRITGTTDVHVSPSARTVNIYPFSHQDDPVFANGAGYAGNNPAGTARNGSGVRRYSNTAEYYVDYIEDMYFGYKWFETAFEEGFWAQNYSRNIRDLHPTLNQPLLTTPVAGTREGYKAVVQYPFGFGLSYTTFDWEIVSGSIAPAVTAQLTTQGRISVDVKVTNTGSFAAKEVVQLYFTPEYTGLIEKAHVNLGAFAKTDIIQPGESQTVTLELEVYHMASFDTFGRTGFKGYVLEAGDYEISVRKNSNEVVDTFAYTVNQTLRWDQDITVSDPILNMEGDPVLENGTPKTADKTLRFATTIFTNTPAANGTAATTALDGFSIDGIGGAGAGYFNPTYLSRNNFVLPTRAATSRSLHQQINNNMNRVPLDRHAEHNRTPVQGVSGPHRLVRNIGADDEEINYDLVMQLGANYDDPLWESVLNQITIDELWMLVHNSGHRMRGIESIGKPTALDLDGPSGINATNMFRPDLVYWTAFPVATVISSSWSKDIAYDFGAAIAAEAATTNIAGWYAPGVNMHRSPYAGRNFEYYSEDPYISGIISAQTTLGASEGGLYAYVKHFAVNDCEDHRDTAGGLFTWLTEQALREIYLRPFEITVKQGRANAMMSSFNRVGRAWAGGSYALMWRVLRDEWGFRGSSVTDWADQGHGYMGVQQGLSAGNDIWLAFGNSSSGNNPATDAPRAFRESNTGINLARTAAHNVLFTYTNTIYMNAVGPQNLVAKRDNPPPFPWFWIWGVLPINVVGFAGVGVWLYFTLFHKKKPKFAPEGASDAGGGDTPFAPEEPLAATVSETSAAQEPPSAAEPAAEEPVAAEPTAAEPAAEEPVAAESAAEEPVAEEPAAEEKPAPKPKTSTTAAKPKTTAAAKPKAASTAAKPKTATAAKPKAAPAAKAEKPADPE